VPFLSSYGQMAKKVTKIDLRCPALQGKILHSKALPFFIALITRICGIPAESHVETLSGGCGVGPNYIGVESNLKVAGATFFLVFRGMEPRASLPSTTDGTLCYG
jgi:hypothetical protein